MAMPGASGNPKLTALWVIDASQAVKIVSRALEMNEGNVSRTAKALKIGRTTLKRWISDNQALKNIVISYKESI